MKQRKYRFGKCHYCVCTACTRAECPYRHKTYRECFACRQRGYNSPRLECDYFNHYLKSRSFKVKRVVKPLPLHYGTYVLYTNNTVYVGSYDKLIKLSEKLGGLPKKLDLIDYNFGGFENEK